MTSPVLISDGYDSVTSFWNEYHQSAASFLSRTPDGLTRSLSRYTKELCAPMRGADVLDIGCGDGFDAIGIGSCFEPKSIEAIEVASHRVERAKENVKRAGLEGLIQVQEMDAHELRYADATFDVVYCHSVLLFLDRSRALAEIRRVLRPNGVLICANESLAENPFLVAYRTLLPRLLPRLWKRKTERLVNRLTIAEIEDIGRHQFESVQHREFYLFFAVLWKVPFWLWHRIVRGRTAYEVSFGGALVATLDAFLMRLIPPLRRWAWVSVIRFERPKA